jgi:hypothetical protein
MDEQDGTRADREASSVENALRDELYTLYRSNGEFNKYLDGDDKDAWPTIHAPSEVLFWLDRTGYIDQQIAFATDKREKEHRDALSWVKADNQRRKIFTSIAEALYRKRLVPFVGAGLSKSLDKHLLLWGEALQAMRDSRARFNKKTAFNEMLSSGDFLGAAELLRRNNTSQTEIFIRNTYNITDRAGFELKGGVQVLPELCKGCIVTTNFDNAIEHAFRKVNNAFENYMQGPVHNKFFPALAKGEHCLLKLHGDAADNQTYVFTRSQYERHYRTNGDFDFTKPLPKALRQIYVSNSLLFIGCSLDKDWTLELFQAVRNTNQYEIPMHYALVEMPPSTTARLQKENTLAKYGITPVWYPHKGYEYVEKLMKLLVEVAEGRLPI